MNNGYLNSNNSLVSKSNFNLRGSALFLLLQSFLFSATYYVDGSVTGGSCSQSDPCELIQTAIDLAIVDGDVVIVTGGMTYEENLLIETGITLKSADPGVPAIIDGSNYDNGSNGSCIIIRSPSGSTTRITTTVEDMIITGGTGTLVNEDVDHDGNYNGPDDEQKKVGGGILVHNASLTSRRNNIRNNGDSSTKEGGGTYAAGNAIDIDDENPDLPPPVFNTRSTILFEETVFEDNSALVGNSLLANGWGDENGRSIDIYFNLASFDVAFDSENNEEDGVSQYWVKSKSNSSFDFTGGVINLGEIEPITQDVWVNPNPEFGSNENSGLTPEDPFLTINHALQLIYPTIDNPITIHLMNGIFSPSSNGESFPISLVSNTELSGSGESETEINAEQTASVILIENSNNVMIKDLSITGGFAEGDGQSVESGNGFGGGILGVYSNIIIENSKIFNNEALEGGAFKLLNTNLNITNTEIVNNTADYSPGIVTSGSNNYIPVLNLNKVNINNNNSIYPVEIGEYVVIGTAINAMSQNVFIYNCTIANNYNNSIYGAPVLIFNIGGGDDLYLASFRNTIFWGNNPSINWVEVPYTVKYCNTGYSDWDGGFPNSFTTNISGDPLFNNPENGDYTLQAESHCIDTGTTDLDGDGELDITNFYGSSPDMGAYEWYPEESEYQPGDVSMDGSVNVLDIVQLIGIILGTQEYTTEQFGLGDLNSDGSLNVLDIVLLVNIILTT